MIKRKLAAVVTALLLSGCASVAPPTSRVELTVAGLPIKATETGQAYIYEVPKSGDGGHDGGLAAQTWSMLGREDKSAAPSDPEDSEYKAVACTADKSGTSGMDNIIDAIAKKAASHRILIVNESHIVTRHRDFTGQLLPKLKAQGFTVFAAETFSNDASGDTAIKAHAGAVWPHRAEGYYSNEPAFGRLIRTAKSLGYQLAAYEEITDPNDKTVYDQDQQIERRETAQAQNLAKLLRTMASDERLVVHVGYGHAVEAPIVRKPGKSVTWMAGKLKVLTGIDPLTVAQTECRSPGGEPFLANAATPERANYYDIIVSHPVDKFTRHRPDWRRAIGDVEVAIPVALKPTNEPLIVEAFVQGEPFDTVPTDRVYVERGEDVPLLLPPGKYTVRAVRPHKE